MIAVLGATGTIGSHVARALAEAGDPARALVRDPESFALDLPVVNVDMLDPDSVHAAIEGATVVFLLTPHGPEQALMERIALDAAVATGAKRIVKISGSGPSLGPNGASPTAATHWHSERAIEASGLLFQFLRPSFLMQNLLEMKPVGPFLAAPMGHAQIAMVDARDVAACAVELLRGESMPSAPWQLTGPAGVNFDNVARLLDVRYVNVPPRIAEAALRRRGATPFEIDHAMRMAAFFASGADGTATDDVFRITGMQPRSLDEFFEDHSIGTHVRERQLAN